MIQTKYTKEKVTMKGYNLKQLVPSGYAAVCYEKEGNTKFRDRVILFFDGKLVFERFCWGEAAGLVFRAWAEGVDSKGQVSWKKPFDAAVKQEELPCCVTEVNEEYLCFDQKAAKWMKEEEKKTDSAHGYGRWKVLLGRWKNK